jgi:hypothetical protein
VCKIVHPPLCHSLQHQTIGASCRLQGGRSVWDGAALAQLAAHAQCLRCPVCQVGVSDTLNCPAEHPQRSTAQQTPQLAVCAAHSTFCALSTAIYNPPAVTASVKCRSCAQSQCNSAVSAPVTVHQQSLSDRLAGPALMEHWQECLPHITQHIPCVFVQV